MAVGHNLFDWSFPASGDLSTKQFYPVALGTDGKVNTISATTTAAIGILQDDPDAAGRACAVRMAGVSKAYVAGAGAGNTINPGSRLAISSDGLLVVTTTANREVIAIALDSSTADGDIISVFVLPGGARY